MMLLSQHLIWYIQSGVFQDTKLWFPDVSLCCHMINSYSTVNRQEHFPTINNSLDTQVH